ncbi:hypothetical protein AVEN_170285-1 [Araneus ventricosus]|uniref:Uncharacterized protein n=1 Tax=Araneus ventricosus TaxID=182803 RepID=A0A4Y2WFM4_ARAVE|nr:hypothetical protein AVEN_57268-1 [Araneus ventricosus]GBO35222.1 hypothetical protein AVEN_170285-1 [Araneus ventricosus]
MAAEKGGIKAVFDLICKTTGIADGKLPIAAIINWLKQAGIVSKETGITESDVNKTHAKTAEDKKKMTVEELQMSIVNLAKEKKMDPKELMDKLASSGPPQMGKVQEVADKFGAKFTK